MADIQKTRGIVLRTFPFKESSLICSFFTEKFGKIKLLAKGARRPKSKFCGTLEPFSHNEIVFYKKEFKELYTLADAVVIENFASIRSEILKFNACEVLCEFFEKSMSPEESDRNVYNLLLSFVREVQKDSESHIRSLTLQYLLKALKLIGVAPHLKDCVRCHKEVYMGDRIGFSFGAGGIICEKDFDDTVVFLSRAVLKVADQVYKERKPEINSNILNELEKFIVDYISYHLSGVTLNSLKFLK
ncbi:MAG: DNA repair protein RecO [candidate division WOR-3 bacterium]